MGSPLVSVIIPAYNHAHYLPGAIQSVLDQTYQDFEILVVDDGSTDNTHEVVQRYADSRIRYIYQENRGLAASRNTGLRGARGDYVAFLDADDMFLPGKLAVQVAWFEAHPSCGMVLSGYYIVNEQGQRIRTCTPWTSIPALEIKDFLFMNPVPPVAVLIARRWIDRVGGFDERFRRIEDWDLSLRLVYAGCRVEWAKEIVSCYRLSPGQMTKDATAQKSVSLQVADKFFRQENLTPDLKMLETEVYTRIYVHFAPQEYGFGQCEAAKESVAQAVRLTPDLLGTRQPELLNKLVIYALSATKAGDPLDYIRRVFDNLPEIAAILRAKKRWALGKIGLETFFAAYQSRDWGQVRRAAVTVMLNAPQLMLNRGVWSILWQSLGKPSNPPL
jgi:glycosyltransferase involved in cell wall biosynthesis